MIFLHHFSFDEIYNTKDFFSFPCLYLFVRLMQLQQVLSYSSMCFKSVCSFMGKTFIFLYVGESLWDVVRTRCCKEVSNLSYNISRFDLYWFAIGLMSDGFISAYLLLLRAWRFWFLLNIEHWETNELQSLSVLMNIFYRSNINNIQVLDWTT